MMGFILRFFVNGFLLLGIDWLFDGMKIEGYGTALLFMIILSILNILVKPILHIISLPITLLTLGLFSFLINAFVFYLSISLKKLPQSLDRRVKDWGSFIV